MKRSNFVAKHLETVNNNPQRGNNVKRRNFVAKHIETFNKPQTHRDRKNDYTRKVKHRNNGV